ncbi:ankyrin repeat-containing domain protein [Xylariaceae sp. FL0255]|nr:ankyrin repeat-containing domain protein [Xylariaceae sp. FL0255]
MAPIFSLPLELVYMTSEYLDSIADVSSWSRTCRSLHSVLSVALYVRVKDDRAVFCWACDEDRIGTVRHLLEAGANPNVAWVQRLSREGSLKRLQSINSYIHNRPSPFPFSHSVAVWEAGFDQDDRLTHPPAVVDDFADTAWFMEANLASMGYHPYMDDSLSEINSFLSPGEPSFAEHHISFWTPLHIAVRWGQDTLVELLLDHGSDIDALSRNFCSCLGPSYKDSPPLWTPLHTALCVGHESTAKLLLSRGASINVSTRYQGSDHRRITALHSACSSDFLAGVRLILDGAYQSDLEIEDHNNMTPLAHACVEGNWSIVDFLLEVGASINARVDQVSLWVHLCQNGLFAEAVRLLDLGADIARTTKHGLPRSSRPHHYGILDAAGSPDNDSQRASPQQAFRVEIVKRLIQNGFDIKCGHIYPLSAAARRHRADIVQLLLDAGANVNSMDIRAMTPLKSAAAGAIGKPSKGSLKDALLCTFQVLLKSEPQIVDVLKALHTLCTRTDIRLDKRESINLLLESLPPLWLDEDGKESLIADVIASGNIAVCAHLRQKGFEWPNESLIDEIIDGLIVSDDLFRDDEGVASHKLKEDALHYILAEVPNGREKLLTGKRLYDSILNDDSMIARFLIEFGAPITHRESAHHGSCLYHAVQAGDRDIVELLLSKGADPNECDATNHPLLMKPVLDEDEDMISLLMGHGALIHSHPSPNALCDGFSKGMLDFVITSCLGYSLEVMLSQPSYGTPSPAELTSYYMSALGDSLGDDSRSDTLDLLLEKDALDPNGHFQADIGNNQSLMVSPLHYCALMNRYELFSTLLNHEADFYLPLPPRPDGSTPAALPYLKVEGTTPLEWLIEWGTLDAIEEVLEDSFGEGFDHLLSRHLGDEADSPVEQLGHDTDNFFLRYAQTACRRLSPQVFNIMGNHSFRFELQDSTNGNTVLHMICDGAENFWPPRNPKLTRLQCANRVAMCIIICISHQIDTGFVTRNNSALRNHAGVSGRDRVNQLATYSGPDEYRQQLAKTLRRRLTIDDRSISPRKVTLEFWQYAYRVDSTDGESDDDEDPDAVPYPGSPGYVPVHAHNWD